MSGSDYRFCISLGTGCQTTYQIRRCSGQTEAYFFDWLVTPMPALLTLLQKGLMFLFDDVNAFEPIEAPPGQSFVDPDDWLHPETAPRNFPSRHRDLGVLFYHDFRHEFGFGDFSRVTEKYAFLTERWNRAMASGGPVLFVRHLVAKEECIALSQVLRSVYPDLEFSILAVVERCEALPSWDTPEIYNVVIQPTPFEAIAKGETDKDAWKGDDIGWSQAFVTAGLRTLSSLGTMPE